jgi:ATP-dependent DNA helicase RecG
MNHEELAMLLEEGEGYKIEYKEGVSGIDKDMVAFANSSGGMIFLGITDDKQIKGINITNRLKTQIQDIANNCRPKAKIFMEQIEFHDKNILIINLREGEDKPYECSSGFYKRIGAISQKLTRDELMGFFKTEGKIRFDELINEKFIYPQDFDKEKLNTFLELAGLSETLSPERILISLGVAEKQENRIYLNHAGVLFFADEPQKFIPWSVFTVVLFKDMEGVDVIDRKEIRGSLFEIVGKVMDFVKLYTKVAYKFTGKPKREEIYEYPLEAIREAVINSVMHRDYFEKGHNNLLRFFPDRILIENVWIEPKGFELGKTIFRRNHIISDLFARIGFGEKLGSGIQRMRSICKNVDALEPIIEYNESYFWITFKPSGKYVKLTLEEEAKSEEVALEILNERQKKALKRVKVKGEITNKEYVGLNKVSRITATRELMDMVRKKILKQEGRGRGSRFISMIQL